MWWKFGKKPSDCFNQIGGKKSCFWKGPKWVNFRMTYTSWKQVWRVLINTWIFLDSSRTLLLLVGTKNTCNRFWKKSNKKSKFWIFLELNFFELFFKIFWKNLESLRLDWETLHRFSRVVWWFEMPTRCRYLYVEATILQTTYMKSKTSFYQNTKKTTRP